MEKLIKYCSEFGIDLDDKAIERFEKYMDQVLKWNEKINLTSITDRDEFIIKHFCDSLTVLGVIDFEEEAEVIDIGTGAGFPAIPLKIARPDLKITMLDSLNKRLSFISNEVLPALDLKCVTIHGRAEDLSKTKEHREAYDYAVSRAVANMSSLSEYCLPFVKVGGTFIAMKGRDWKEEVNNAENAVMTLGGEFSDLLTFELPDGSSRGIVIVDKILKCPSKYPRRGVKINKNPL